MVVELGGAEEQGSQLRLGGRERRRDEERARRKKKKMQYKYGQCR